MIEEQIIKIFAEKPHGHPSYALRAEVIQIKKAIIVLAQELDRRDKKMADPSKFHSSKEVEKVGVEVAVLNELSASRSVDVNVEEALTVLAKEIDLLKQRL